VSLRLYSDRSYVPEGTPHAVALYPFWGKNPEDPADPNAGRFDGYAAQGASFLSLTSLEDADAAVFPRDWSSLSGADETAAGEEFIARAHDAGKPTVVFFGSDSDERLPYQGAVVFQTSLYRSRRRPNEFALPAWSEDFLERYLDRELPLRQKGPKPIVGFCGLAPRMRFSRLRRRALRSGAATNSSVRTLALAALAREPAVESNVILRAQFLGGALAGGSFDAAALQRARGEYVRNMVESDYVLCARGAGNFSYRLYETLSCGRIPVFVDTDCVLPYDFLLDWRDYCVWIDARDVDQVGRRVAEFHERLGADEFVELQRSCRRLWEEYVRPEGFFRNFHRHLGAIGRPARLLERTS
jgi:hypothetical protein